MKLNVSRESMAQATSLAERITGKKESLPVLSCIVLHASTKHLSVGATNLEAGINITVPAHIEEGGTVALPAQVLCQTVRSMGGDTITLRDADGNLALESKSSRNLIKAVPHEEFPAFEKGVTKEGFTISRTLFLSALQSVAYAASPSMIRPELGSIYLSFDQGAVVAVATDSFRLAEKTIKNATKKRGGDLLVPLKHTQELIYILEHIREDQVRVGVEENQLTVEGGGVSFVSRVVDAQFPQYREIIPKQFITEATLLKGDFAEVLRKARIFSGTEQQISFHIYPKRKIFSATARSGEIGEMSDSINAALSGDDIDINFHIGYLADCLPVVQSDSISLGFAGIGKPLVIRGVSDSSFRYLAMPLNR